MWRPGSPDSWTHLKLSWNRGSSNAVVLCMLVGTQNPERPDPVPALAPVVAGCAAGSQRPS